jgi:hypothetical protein
MVVAFPGNQFKGEIAPALEELVKSGTIRIIDLAFVMLTSERGGFVSEEDIQAVAEGLEPNSAAAMLVWEDVWATRFTEALVNAGGQLVDIQRVPRELVEEALAWAEENRAPASAG